MYCSLGIDQELRRTSYDIRCLVMNMFMKRERHLNGKLHLHRQIKRNTLYYSKCCFHLKSNDIHQTSASWETFSSFTVYLPPNNI